MSTTLTTDLNSSIGNLRIKKIVREGIDYDKGTKNTARLLFTKEVSGEMSFLTTSASTSEIMKPIGENEKAPNTPIIQGFPTEIAIQRYGLGRAISYETKAVANGKTIEDMAKETINTALRSEDYWCMSVLRRAMDTSLALADGNPLITKVGVIRSGGTQPNTFADVQYKLSYSSLLKAQDIMSQLVDHSGNPITRGGKYTLLVPDEGETKETAFQLAGANGADMRPGSELNDKNFFTKFEGHSFNVVASSALTLAAAKAIGETTASFNDGSVASLAYKNRWFLIDMETLQSTQALVLAYLKDSQNLIKNIETETLAMETNMFTFMGFGVRASLRNFIFGSNGTQLETNF